MFNNIANNVAKQIGFQLKHKFRGREEHFKSGITNTASCYFSVFSVISVSYFFLVYFWECKEHFKSGITNIASCHFSVFFGFFQRMQGALQKREHQYCQLLFFIFFCIFIIFRYLSEDARSTSKAESQILPVAQKYFPVTLQLGFLIFLNKVLQKSFFQTERYFLGGHKAVPFHPVWIV